VPGSSSQSKRHEPQAGHTPRGGQRQRRPLAASVHGSEDEHVLAQAGVDRHGRCGDGRARPAAAQALVDEQVALLETEHRRQIAAAEGVRLEAERDDPVDR
jgi:hypothetical protein